LSAAFGELINLLGRQITGITFSVEFFNYEIICHANLFSDRPS